MRYPGGKGRCYQHLVSMMPPHRTYIETHLGGGAVLRRKRPAELNIGIEADEAVVAKWAGITLPNTEIVHGDACAFLKGYAFTGAELVYSDPPYPKSTRARARIYKHDYDDEDHAKLLGILLRLPCMVIVSSYANELYDGLLKNWRRIEFPGDSHTGPRTEVAWLNFEEPDLLHDPRYRGQDFRDRERIRRRRAGLARRIGNMPTVERQALFQDLAREFGPELRSAAGQQ